MCARKSWSFGFDSQTRGTRKNRATPCVILPGSSRVPAPSWVGSRSLLGWWLGVHQPPWSFGFDSQTRGTRENRRTPCVNLQGSSRVPAQPWVGSRSPDGWDQIPRWAGGWTCTRHPGVLVSIPKREEPGKTGQHPMLKHRVPHGFHPAFTSA
jgi:hypothetical protein